MPNHRGYTRVRPVLSMRAIQSCFGPGEAHQRVVELGVGLVAVLDFLRRTANVNFVVLMLV